MRSFLLSRLGATIAGLSLACAGAGGAEAGKWERLPSLPDAVGVAAPFAGVSGWALLVAGGANFPKGMPWEGGKKTWTDSVWVLEQGSDRFREAGRLTRTLAYGVSASTREGVICAGGCDAERHYADVFRLSWKDGALEQTPLPALPIALAYASGALIDRKLYVACGTEMPGETAASNRAFVLDLDREPMAWHELPRLPAQPRLLATAAGADGAFHLLGGVALEPGKSGKAERVYLREAWRFREGAGWERLADLPRGNAAAPSPAPVAKGQIYLLAGDDGSRRDFQPIAEHPGFVPSVFAFDVMKNQWSESGTTPAPRATVPVVEWNGAFVIPSGEMRPGVRSPEVWSFAPLR